MACRQFGTVWHHRALGQGDLGCGGMSGHRAELCPAHFLPPTVPQRGDRPRMYVLTVFERDSRKLYTPGPLWGCT